VSEFSNWLPPLVTLDSQGGDWNRYIDAVYTVFHRDFVRSRTQFRGKQIATGTQTIDGKEKTFWHLISEGRIEDNRTPDLRRCERIAWIRPLIEHDGDAAVLSWPNQRGRAAREVLWAREVDFAVILDKRPNCWWLWTAYMTNRQHTRNRFTREYEAWTKSRRRP
jgi:hypothetical protein